jgi:hypothetical protein
MFDALIGLRFASGSLRFIGTLPRSLAGSFSDLPEVSATGAIRTACVAQKAQLREIAPLQ